MPATPILENDHHRRVTGLSRGELLALLAVYVLTSDHPTTVNVVAKLIERVHGFGQATSSQFLIDLERRGYVKRGGRCCGSILIGCTHLGEKRVRELRGDFERQHQGAAE